MESMKSKLYYYKVFYEMEDKWEYYRMKKVKRYRKQSYAWYHTEEQKWHVSHTGWGMNMDISKTKRCSDLEVLLLFGQEALTHNRVGRRPKAE